MLPTEPYLTQKPLWPTERQHILAHHNADSLVVYQAHRPEVARYAVQHHTLGGPYSALPLRDTWVTGRPWTAWERPE